VTEKLEKLIALAVADGEITTRELEILKKKAKEEGVDEDELEMLLDTRLYEHKEQLKEKIKNSIPPPTEKPKSNKEGDIKKCPSCGALAEPFNTKCSECGHEFRNIQVANSFERLMEMLNNIEITDSKSSDAKYASVISNFPIPNTKEDLLEFLAHATPEANKKVSFWDKIESDCGPALFKKTWYSKCQQIIMKARFSMKEDKTTLAEIEHYAKELKIK
jgi:hypothetical protein